MLATPRRARHTSRHALRPRTQDADAATVAKMLSRVGALERTLAEEAAEDDAALARLGASARAHLEECDAGFAAAEKAIKASMKRLKDMAKQYAR